MEDFTHSRIWWWIDLVLGSLGLAVLITLSICRIPEPHQWTHFFAGWLLNGALWGLGWRKN